MTTTYYDATDPETVLHSEATRYRVSYDSDTRRITIDATYSADGLYLTDGFGGVFWDGPSTWNARLFSGATDYAAATGRASAPFVSVRFAAVLPFGAQDAGFVVEAENIASNVTLSLAIHDHRAGPSVELIGSDADSIYLMGPRYDRVHAGSGNDGLFGGDGNDLLSGGSGDDQIDGGVGADNMRGGAGDDRYVVDNRRDSVIELAAEGSLDTVVSTSSSYTLPANVEKLDLAGSAVAGTGNDLANRLTGNVLANLLFGAGGDDVIDGGDGVDTLVGGAGDDLYYATEGDRIIEKSGQGTDTVVTTARSFTLAANVENLVIDGGGTARGNKDGNVIVARRFATRIDGLDGDDSLTGSAASDILDGGSGADVMTGGSGNDTYFVDSTGDRVIELAFHYPPYRPRTVSGGIDTIVASVDRDLAAAGDANVENLILVGSAIRGGGNELENRITGDGRANWLDGRAGDDTLDGGAGRDVLSGGDGADRFVFRPGQSGGIGRPADQIRDFSQGDGDRIDLSAFPNTLTFVGASGFSGHAREVWTEIKGGDTFVHVDVDGDRVTDFDIRLTGTLVLTASDFLL